jgi:signal transduction histidine kinase
MEYPETPQGEQPVANAGEPAIRRGRASGSRLLSLRNWPVSWRLFAVILIALVMGLSFGGLRVAAAAGTAGEFARVSQLAILGQQVTGLAQAIEDERDATAGFIAAGRPAAGPAALRSLYATTDTQAAKVRTLADQVGGSFPASVTAKVAAVLARIADLRGLRAAAQHTQFPALPVIEDYSSALADLLSLNDEIAQGSADTTLAQSVQTLGSLSRMKEAASEQRAILYAAFTQGNFDLGGMDALTTAQAAQASDLAAFDASATLGQLNLFGNTVANAQVDQAQLIEQHVIELGRPDISGLGISPAVASGQWYSAMTYTIGQMRTVEAQLAASIVTRSQQLRQDASRSALLTAIVTALVLLFVLIATLVVARTLVEPLRRLRAGALAVATIRLPERVRELSEAADPDANLEVQPIEVLSTDEIGQVARAFDQVHREAVRLAGNEALLRTSLNSMFVSLSRRSQSLLERLARTIDSLELSEDDPQRLSDLFALDHLVTRMRRHSENLLVLAGHETPRKWSEPVPLADVARAAASEIEQYDRVALNIQPGIAVSGQAVTDVVHLLSEIIENATMFSSRGTKVSVSGQEVPSGGVLLEIRDSGIGMSQARLDELNWRLDNPPVIDVSISRHMGLFAVAHLAARHGVRVRLRASPPSGLNAMVWLPGAITERESRWRGRRSSLAQRPGPGIQAGSQREPARQRFALRDAQGSQPAGPAARSTWFRAKRRSSSSSSRTRKNTDWRSAAIASEQPVRGDITVAGLPQRIPQANLHPGSAAAENGPAALGSEPEAAAHGSETGPMEAPRADRRDREAPHAPRPRPPQRSPELARSRLAGFQQGGRRAEQQADRAGEGAGAER